MPSERLEHGDLNEALGRLRAAHDVSTAERYLRAEDERTIAQQIELAEIPAPSFQEQARGARVAELMTEAGLVAVGTDSAGNVLGRRPGGSDARPLVVSAHLDTVFPPDVDVSVQRDGDVLRGAGIIDDARGLAVLLAVARAIASAGIETETPLLFVATVGEEGIGDLRGVKTLFGPEGGGADASGFISLDGAGLDRIVVRGLGSRRFRVTATGPGGHSWVDWGTPNPIHLLSRAAAALLSIPLSAEPESTLTIARWGGGKSINAIPQQAWLEIDSRCADADTLERLEAEIRRGLADTEAAFGEGLTLRVESIGFRPAAATDPNTLLVRAARAATRGLGREAKLAISSTDANVPMALGIPAVTIGCGGEGGKTHTTDEWYRNVRGPEGAIRALLTVLLTAGVSTPV